MSNGGPCLSTCSIAPAQVRSLRRFITFDQTTCLVAVAVILLVHTAVEPSPHLLLLAAMVALAAGLMGRGRRALKAGNVRAAVLWVAAANWGVSLGATAVATFCLPITVVAAMLPSILAVPYLGVRDLWRVSIASMIVATLVAAAGTLQDFSGLTADLEPWIPPAVMLFFLPFITGLVVTVSAHNSARLRRVLAEEVEANERLRASEAQLVRSRARLVAAIDEERRRIARDLHDGAQQRLICVALGLERARRALPPDQHEAAAVLRSLGPELCASMTELRALAYGLCPPVLADRGLGEALVELAERTQAPCRISVDDLPRFSPAVEGAVYWSCAEALQNVVKHAGPAATLRLRVALEGNGRLVFAVEDDGVGFDLARVERGQGLTNMADRVGAVGGELTVSSAPGQGARIHGVVPLAGVGDGPGSEAEVAYEPRPSSTISPRPLLRPSTAPFGDHSFTWKVSSNSI